MRRLFVALLASLLLAGLIVPAVGASPRAAAASAVPKVVVVVGPAGAATDRYRAEGRKAAALARRYTPDVTEIYSPDATWPAVKTALQRASVVIYMGHGNGWPSKYRDSLYPATQNGFGLNPKSGGGDSEHQYFGEAKIAADIRLADDAVVLLNHLCYASGNSEPGLAEGTIDQARQRVDNFAAGFIKAGASAVIAEAYASPNHMLKAVLEGKRSIESTWRGAPSRNGNAFAFESTRSPGYIAQMDPERDASGFTRSIVLKAGLASSDVLRGARGSAASVGRVAVPSAPSLMAAGIAVKQPTLASTTAASTITYKIPYSVEARRELPKTILASVRWDALDPIVTDTAALPPAEDTGAAPAAAEPPDLGLVAAERLGDLVAPVKVKIAKKSLSFKVATPTAPGRYRLTVTLHDSDGVAYDIATQALLPTLIVRVTGDLDAAIVGPTATHVAPGAAAAFPLWVANLGRGAWGHESIASAKDPEGAAPAVAARITGQWVALGGVDDETQLAAAAAASVTAVDLPAGLAPGAVVPADLGVFAPSVAGEYLLVLDILTPEHGSLVAAGMEPTIIRVSVAEAETAAPVAPVLPADPGTTSSTEGATVPPAPTPSPAVDPAANPAAAPAPTSVGNHDVDSPEAAR